jgi:prefoldin subunit 5|tara:strand:+ start:34 stop:294 length:261 start_codon:yes stop_codon:yes gene_type:complete
MMIEFAREMFAEQMQIIESQLQIISTEMWMLSVDDPETATVESERNITDPIKFKMQCLVTDINMVREQIELVARQQMHMAPTLHED